LYMLGSCAVTLGLALVLVLVMAVVKRARRRPRPIPPPAPPIDEAECQERSPWSELKDRLLILPPGQRTLRAVVFAVVALIMAAAVVIGAGRHFPATTLLAGFAAGARVSISIRALVLGVISAAAAWVLILAGLFLADWRVRIPGLVLIGLGAAAERHVLGSRLSFFGAAPGVAALAGVLLIGVLTIAADVRAGRRKAPRTGTRNLLWTPVILIAIAALVLTVYAGQAIRLGGLASLGQGSVSVLELLYVTVVLVIPMLLLAGADVADFGGAIADGVSVSLASKPIAVPLVAGAAAAVAELAVVFHSLGTRVFVNVALAAALLGGLAYAAAVTRPYQGWKKPIPALMAAAIAFMLVLGLQVATGLQKVPSQSAATLSPPDAQYVHNKSQPTFSIRFPHACGVPEDNSQPPVIAVSFIGCRLIPGPTTRHRYTFSFAIFSFAATSTNPCATLRAVSNVPNERYRHAPDDEGWRTCAFTGSGNQGIAWIRPAGNRIWLLLGQTVGQPATFNFAEPLLRAMRDTWRPAATPGPIPDTGPGIMSVLSRFAARTSVIWLAVTIAAALALILWRRRADDVKPALMYLVIMGAWVTLTFAGRTAAVQAGGHHLLSLQLGGVQALAGLGTFGYLAVIAFRRWPGTRRNDRQNTQRTNAAWRRLRRLFVLNCSLLLTWAAATLYGTASRLGSTLAIVQGIVVLAALLWELTFSGQLLNSGEPRSVLPRPARLLMYLGYLLLTASAVLQLSTLRSPDTGARVEAFDAETIVQAGIIELGVPLAITIFLINWPRRGACQPTRPAASGNHHRLPDVDLKRLQAPSAVPAARPCGTHEGCKRPTARHAGHSRLSQKPVGGLCIYGFILCSKSFIWGRDEIGTADRVAP
jgi:hypothetical protein